MARLYDGQGNTVTEWNPRFEAVKREIQFSSTYNPAVERRGRAPHLAAKAGSENWIQNRDRLKMMADARDAAQYSWIGGVLARIVLYVCGKCHCKSSTGDDMVDAAYDDYFHAWCGDTRNDDGTTRCDITGRHRLLKMVQMSFLAFLVDGDCGLVEVDPLLSPTAQLDLEGNPIPGTGDYCLQCIEADRIGSPIETEVQEDYIGGVKIDIQTGRVIYYRVYRRTRTNMYVDKRELEPKDFIHVFDADRSDEYRGRTKLLRLLNDLRDIRETFESEKVAIKTQSQWAALVSTKDPFNNTGSAAWDGKTMFGTPTQEAVWGKILKMGEGENFDMLAPSARPSGSTLAFVQTLIRMMSLSLGLSYGLLWDLASLGGATARIEVQSDLRKIQYWQDNIIASIILNRIRKKVIAQGISRGELPAVPGWEKCSWNFGPHITADLGYEMEADIQSVHSGFQTVEAIAAKHGKTTRDIFEHNADTFLQALKVGAEKGAPVEAFAGGLYPDGTELKAAFDISGPVPPPPPPAGSIAAIGDKGVAKLLELLEDVGDGSIDRESGIETAIRVFGLTRGQAEKIMPEEPSEEELNRAAGLDTKGRHAPIVAAGSAKPGANKSTKAKKKTKKK
jgi:hypothetical protein